MTPSIYEQSHEPAVGKRFTLSRVGTYGVGMSSHLLGLTEIAALLGVSRQRASQLATEYEDFPRPVAELASGRIWETAAIEAWASDHPVRPPGRPPSEPDRTDRQ